MGVNIIAGLWGFAEATLFFIVPDVWLTFAGRDQLRRGLIACAYALVGALIGGMLMYSWGRYDPVAALETVELLPAISSTMSERVHNELREQGALALLLGPLSGTPYKVYSVQASGASIGAGYFFLVSIPARLIRFVLVTVFAHWALDRLSRRFPQLNRIATLSSAWVVFYAFYFAVMAS